MTKRKIFVAMLILMLMTSAFSFAVENDGVKGAVADVLRFDTLTADGFATSGKVKRKEKVGRSENLNFFDNENLKNLRDKGGIVNNSMVVEQARRDVEAVDMRFEDLE